MSLPSEEEASSTRRLSRHWTLTRENNWFLTSFLLLSDVIGTGILGLPYAFNKLGWLPGIFSLLLFCFLGQFTGKILCKLVVAFPESQTLGRMAEHFYGKIGIFSCYTFLYVYIFFNISQYLLISGRAVQGAIYSDDMCISTAMLYVVCVLLPLSQVRTLHSVS